MNHLRKNLISSLLFLLLALLSFGYYAQSDNLLTSFNLTIENNSSNSSFCPSTDNYDNDQLCVTPEKSFLTITEKYSGSFKPSCYLILPSYFVWQPPKAC